MGEKPLDWPYRESFEPLGLDLAVRSQRHVYVPNT
jgi:hypothetical protein